MIVNQEEIVNVRRSNLVVIQVAERGVNQHSGRLSFRMNRKANLRSVETHLNS